jgi:hypothetical protein
LSPLEQAIRNALERAERSNPDIRARIYQSARNALETGMRKQDVSDADVLQRQRDRLEATIRAIENEELERLAAIARLEKVILESLPEVDVEPDAARAPHLAPDVRPDMRHEPEAPAVPVVEPDHAADEEMPAAAPSIVPERFSRAGRTRRMLKETHRHEDELLAELAAGKQSDAPAAHEEEDPAWAAPDTPAAARVTVDRKSRIRRAGSLIVALFVYSVLLAAVGAGGWWVYSTGMLKTLTEREGNVPRVTPQAEAEDFDPGASPLDPQRGFSGDWINVFRPGIGKTTAHSAASVTDVADSDGNAVLIVSGKPDSEGEVEIEIPAEALQNLAGKKVVFAITARTEGDEPTQIYVECDFGSLGDCGRHRYPVVQDRADQLFRVDFTGKLGPGTPGRILINSDVTGAGGAIRVYGVRVLPAG